MIIQPENCLLEIAHMSYDDFANKRTIINAFDADEMKAIDWMIKVQTKAIRRLFRGWPI